MNYDDINRHKIDFNKEFEIKKAIGKTGNSMSVIIPADAKNFGFDFDQEVTMKMTNNKILIELAEKKNTYYSRISSFKSRGPDLIPNFNSSNKSARFEELDHFTERGPGGWDLKLYYDHNEQRYLMFACGNNVKDRWWGNYITEKEFSQLKEGAINPFHLRY